MRPHILTSASAALALSALVVTSAPAGSSDSLFVIAGPNSPAGAREEFVIGPARLGEVYRLYIEVLPGQPNLVIDVFDANTGDGDTTDGNDELESDAGRDHSIGGFDATPSTTTYTVIDPSGATVASPTIGNSGGTDQNDWTTIHTQAAPAAGHWLVEIDMTGDDYNAFGIRAHDGDPGPGGIENNAYWERFAPTGTTGVLGTPSPRNFTLFPYVTEGCDLRFFDWDADNNQVQLDIALTNRNGFFSQPVSDLGFAAPFSPNGRWGALSFIGWADAGSPGAGLGSGGYGAWAYEMTARLYSSTRSNIITSMFGVSGGSTPTPPGAGGSYTAPPADETFRVYLPTDGGLAPELPWVSHTVRNFGATFSNPPVPGEAGTLLLRITVRNPHPVLPITFDANAGLIVTAEIPGGVVTSSGPASATASQGTFTVPPAGSGGTVSWDPGLVAGGSSATLDYSVSIGSLPSGTTVLSGPAPTTASFVDHTGNLLQPQATVDFGPLCEISVTTGGPLLVKLTDFAATYENPGDPVDVTWTTAAELDTMTFDVYQVIATNPEGMVLSQVNEDPIPAQGSPVAGANYAYQDANPMGDGEERSYVLIETELSGKTNTYGPVTATSSKGTPTAVQDWLNHR